ncbi:hypothetical protein O181_054011 [Austropuccinia psidii MF-1]|uniref:CCHC-type domain-containing protein n=1 Tax=Austropuccinia psidii MF-1 TaxID=1389203 RepID=A0A9Q3E8M0_9BASI|nr:hypothetical protein [Austropuccinia psidii MF-1]
MRQDHGKHDWLWWKSHIITKCANNSWSFKMENSFQSDIFNSEKDKPLTWFLKQKDRLSSLHPDMSDSTIKKTWRRTRTFYQVQMTRIGKAWTRSPIHSKIVPKISREDKRPERPVLRCHKCGSTSHLANTCAKNPIINEVQVIEEVQYAEYKDEFD